MVKIRSLLDILCGLIALFAVAPVLSYLDKPLLLLLLCAIPLGYFCDRRQRHLLSTVPATLLALCGIAFYAIQITRAEVALPVAHALILLLAIRLLTPKQGRDYLQIFLLALFILAGTSLIHLEIGFVVYLVLQIFSVTLGLVFLTVFATDEQTVMTRRELFILTKVGLIIPAVSLVLMLAFFVILPRTRNPMWNFLNPAAQATAGLADSVQPGSYSQISTIKQLAFRAEGPELAPEDRYWRVLVLNAPQQQRWIRTEPPPEHTLHIVGAKPRSFTIYPEP
ncbi:MAG: DUF3488 domain-containing protein, partial [Desulfuromonadales bacterium]|nr:DUF3488 domain-containing protein [Desulfuromonadales bacterium]